MIKQPTKSLNSPDIHAKSAAFLRHPRKLFVETTTRCNLSCIMCVKQAEGCGIIEGDLATSTFAALEAAFPTLEALILNGVGEPLLHPQLADFVRRAKELMPESSWVGFQSNGLLIDESNARDLLEAGLDKLCLSLDAALPHTFKKIRAGGQFSAIEKAFQALAKTKAAVGYDKFRVGIEFVITPDNLRELSPALAWAASQGASFAIVTHALPYSETEASKITYETCSAEAIELFTRWQSEAATEGIDIYCYPRIIWKYPKSHEDLKVINFVERIKNEARQTGIYLDLKKLFSLDSTHLQHMGMVFNEAMQTAKACNIELQLPELCLKERRHCDFVEDAGMFVSWDGQIFPCYFLWHQYLCYASGWRQTVKPKSFGSLTGQDILSTWNSEAFTEFRQNVTRYDYPYCASCILAPCDYIQTDNFEQDCYISEEPCGSCLWCMGIFQCLR